MGIFYTNTTLLAVPRQSVVEFMRKHQRIGYVSPDIVGHVVVYDQATEQQENETISRFSAQIAHELNCVALTVLVLDGDVFCYWLYEKDKLIDRYDSLPDYFDDSLDPTPHGGDVELLCSVFNKPASREKLHQLFQQLHDSAVGVGGSDSFLTGDEAHAELANLLNLPIITVGIGFYTIEGGFVHTDFSGLDMLRCG